MRNNEESTDLASQARSGKQMAEGYGVVVVDHRRRLTLLTTSLTTI